MMRNAYKRMLLPNWQKILFEKKNWIICRKWYMHSINFPMQWIFNVKALVAKTTVTQVKTAHETNIIILSHFMRLCYFYLILCILFCAVSSKKRAKLFPSWKFTFQIVANYALQNLKRKFAQNFAFHSSLTNWIEKTSKWMLHIVYTYSTNIICTARILWKNHVYGKATKIIMENVRRLIFGLEER